MAVARWSAALLLTLLLVVPGTPIVADAPVDDAVAPITRFAQVGERLYRGGQPDAAGFTYLKTLGVRTVISLRNDAAERALVESLGMAFVHIPVSIHPFGIGDELPEKAVKRFFEIVDNPASGLVFLHCRRGADRTGSFIGLYRIARQGWSLERAYDEARDVGMRWWYFPVKDKMKTVVSTLIPPLAAAR